MERGVRSLPLTPCISSALTIMLTSIRGISPLLVVTHRNFLLARGYKSVAQHRSSVDWERWQQTPYVVVDPNNPNLLLYLDEGRYFALLQTCVRAGKALVVICDPSSTPTDDPSKSSPFRGVSWRFATFMARRSLWGSLLPKDVHGNKKSRDRMVPLTYRNICHLLPEWTSLCAFWAGKGYRGKNYKRFSQAARNLAILLKHNGPNFVIQRMKVSLHCMYMYVGGKPLSSTHDLGHRVSLINGLPKWLPVELRACIRAKSVPFIRIIGTFLFSYKAFMSDWKKPSIETITAPPYVPDEEYELFSKWIPNALSFLFPKFVAVSTKDMRRILGPTATFRFAAGPNHKIAILGAGRDALWHLMDENSTLYRWAKYLGMPMFWSVLRSCASATSLSLYSQNLLSKQLRGGKLSYVYEAAGKVRVIAIVDHWTQCALRPLHDLIFRLLKEIPMDGTFDQEGTVQKLADRGFKTYYSYDLKSATDLIPIQLYEAVLKYMIPEGLVPLWKELLVGREYFTCHKSLPDTVTYTRGQPMGAYSSWATLALVHHVIVQYAASKVNKFPFDAYAVLGDDIVIADQTVASSYRDVCGGFGIQLSIPKSLISEDGLFEFASQRLKDGINLSPLSLKEELNVRDGESRRELASRIYRRGWIKKPGISALRLLFLPQQWKVEAEYLSRGIISPTLGVALMTVLSPFSSVRQMIGDKGSPAKSLFAAIKLQRGGLLGELSHANEMVLLDQIKEKDPYFLFKCAALVADTKNAIKERVSVSLKRVDTLGKLIASEKYPEVNPLFRDMFMILKQDIIDAPFRVSSLPNPELRWMSSGDVMERYLPSLEVGSEQLKELPAQVRWGVISEDWRRSHEANNLPDFLHRLLLWERQTIEFPDFSDPDVFSKEARRTRKSKVSPVSGTPSLVAFCKSWLKATGTSAMRLLEPRAFRNLSSPYKKKLCGAS